MLSLELKNFSSAPTILAQFNAQKTHSQALAEDMPAPYRQRMLQCCDWIGVRKFDNEYQRISKTAFCRVRGCPLCDFCEYKKIMGKVARVIKKQKKAHPNSGIVVLRTVPEECEISDLQSTIDNLSIKIGKVCQQKSFPTNVWIRLTFIQPDGEIFKVCCTLILFVNPSFFSGYSYLSTKAWIEIFGCGIKKDQCLYNSSQYLDRCASEVKSSFFDLSSVSGSLVSPFIAAVKNKRLRSFSSKFNELVQAKEKARSSADARVMTSTINYSVFVPNVLAHKYEENTYLQFEEFDLKSALDDIQLDLL